MQSSEKKHEKEIGGTKEISSKDKSASKKIKKQIANTGSDKKSAILKSNSNVRESKHLPAGD